MCGGGSQRLSMTLVCTFDAERSFCSCFGWWKKLQLNAPPLNRSFSEELHGSTPCCRLRLWWWPKKCTSFDVTMNLEKRAYICHKSVCPKYTILVFLPTISKFFCWNGGRKMRFKIRINSSLYSFWIHSKFGVHRKTYKIIWKNDFPVGRPNYS